MILFYLIFSPRLSSLHSRQMHQPPIHTIRDKSFILNIPENCTNDPKTQPFETVFYPFKVIKKEEEFKCFLYTNRETIANDKYKHRTMLSNEKWKWHLTLNDLPDPELCLSCVTIAFVQGNGAEVSLQGMSPLGLLLSTTFVRCLKLTKRRM